jgi:hypothetical protein
MFVHRSRYPRQHFFFSLALLSISVPKISSGWLQTHKKQQLLRLSKRFSRNPNTARPQFQHGGVRRSQIRRKHVTKWNIHADQQTFSRPLTAAEIAAHPEYPHVYWDLKPTKKDSVDVAKGRGGPLKLAYEIHGHGPRKIVVCGLDVLSYDLDEA